MGGPPAWDVIYYRAPDDSVPSERFLDACPRTIQSRFYVVLDDVAQGPPLEYRGGGYWEAMGDKDGIDMTGWFEVRLEGPKREQFRLFCRLENGTSDDLAEAGLSRPAIAVIEGGRKAFGTKFRLNFYQHVKDLGSEYLATRPRRIALPDPLDLEVTGVVCDHTSVTVTVASGAVYSLPVFGRLIAADPASCAVWSWSPEKAVIYWPVLNESRPVSDFLDQQA